MGCELLLSKIVEKGWDGMSMKTMVAMAVVGKMVDVLRRKFAVCSLVEVDAWPSAVSAARILVRTVMVVRWKQ